MITTLDVDLTPRLRLRVTFGPHPRLEEVTGMERHGDDGPWLEAPDAWSRMELAPDGVRVTGTPEGVEMLALWHDAKRMFTAAARLHQLAASSAFAARHEATLSPALFLDGAR